MIRLPPQLMLATKYTVLATLWIVNIVPKSSFVVFFFWKKERKTVYIALIRLIDDKGFPVHLY